MTSEDNKMRNIHNAPMVQVSEAFHAMMHDDDNLS